MKFGELKKEIFREDGPEEYFLELFEEYRSEIVDLDSDGNREKILRKKIGRALAALIQDDDGTLTIPEGVDYLPDYILKENIMVKKVIMPSTMQNIGAWAFSRCKNLEKVILNEGLQGIGERAFWDAQIKEVVIPSTVKEIGDLAFNMKSLKKATLKGSVKNMELHPTTFLDDVEIIEDSHKKSPEQAM